MTPNDLRVSLKDTIETAMEAENKGVPVDWREMSLRLYTSANNHIAALEAQMSQDKQYNEG